jgi:hypothetical protein
MSLLPDGGMPIEQISRLVGHSGTSVMELINHKQIGPAVEDEAVFMDRIFPVMSETQRRSHAETHQAPSIPLGTGPDLRAACRNRTDDLFITSAHDSIDHGSYQRLLSGTHGLD